MNPIIFNPNIENYAPLLYFGFGGLLFISTSLFVSYLLRPSNPTPSKLEVYESGEETIGSSQAGFSIRYFQIAILFLLFEVDIILLFTYLIKASEQGFLAASPFSAIQLLFFILLLALGLWYPWKKGNLEWEKPEPARIQESGLVPPEVYLNRINELLKLNSSRTEETRIEENGFS